MARADNGSGKTTDSHHHIYDSRYPIDPAAQLRPADATAADYRALRQRLDIGRHVMVQPSTYGTDNRCLLDALSQFRADARGIAAVADTVTDSELRNLHDAGVREGEVQKWQFLRYTDEPNRPACNGKSG